MVRLLEELTDKDRVLVLETLGFPYVIIHEDEGDVIVFTMELARGNIDLLVARKKLTAAEGATMLEAIKAKGLIETGQEIRERLMAYELEEHRWGFNFELCTSCSGEWPHGYIVTGAGELVNPQPISTVSTLLGVEGQVEEEHLIALLKQAATQGIAVDVFDGQDIYRPLLDAFLASQPAV